LKLPLDATVDTLIAQMPDLPSSLSVHEGCDGFLVAPKKSAKMIDMYYDDYDDELPSPSSGLAEKLTANGGTLLRPGQTLASYGIDADSCTEVMVFAVFADPERHPIVFKKDVHERGFGESVYDYVKLNPEDKELVAARKYFSAPLLPWLDSAGSDGDLNQTITFSMEDNFAEVPKTILTVHLFQKGGGMEASCTNMAGDSMCSVTLAGDDVAARLQKLLCAELNWTSVVLWDGAERIPEASKLSGYTVITVERAITMEHINGCYQFHASDVHPAGYSASGTSSANLLILEPGRAGLQYHFKGDYKRAEELRKLVMADARWSIESLGEGVHVVRVVGRARLDRFWVHERSGYEGDRLQGYECYAMVTIPLRQLERGQTEERFHTSTTGSGWTCGSEKYKCSFFLPMCLLHALRDDKDSLLLRQHLNESGSTDYPYNLLSSSRRGRSEVSLSPEAFDMIRNFRQSLGSKAEVTKDEIIQLQSSTLHDAAADAAAAAGIKHVAM
jgi:hypothetical protein